MPAKQLLAQHQTDQGPCRMDILVAGQGAHLYHHQWSRSTASSSLLFISLRTSHGAVSVVKMTEKGQNQPQIYPPGHLYQLMCEEGTEDHQRLQPPKAARIKQMESQHQIPHQQAAGYHLSAGHHIVELLLITPPQALYLPLTALHHLHFHCTLTDRPTSDAG